VYLSEDVKFIVERGAVLELDGAHLQALPNARWKGIDVWGNSELEQKDENDQTVNSAGILIVKNQSIVEGAKTAIYTRDSERSWPDYPNYWGGLVKSTNSTFKNNRRTAAFMSYNFENKSEFRNCLIIEADDISDESIGVTIWDCEGVLFENNRFENLDLNGIYGIDAEISVLNGNEFIQCRSGIGLLSSNPFASSAIIGDLEGAPNEFDCTYEAIYLSGVDKGTGIVMLKNNVTNGDFGIIIEGESIYSIRENNFDDQGVGAMIFRNTGSNSNYSSCNNIFDANYGNFYIEDNVGSQFLTNNFSTKIKDVTVMSLFNTGQINWQGITRPADNCFSKAPYDEISVSDPNSAFAYFVPETGDPCKYPTNNLNDGGTNQYVTNDVPNLFDNDCEFIRLPISAAKEDLDQINNEINLLKSNLSSSELSSVSLKSAEISKDMILRKITLDNLESGNLEYLDQLFGLELNFKDQFGVAILNKNYNHASEILNNIEDSDFVSIQQINLKRLINPNYTPSAIEKSLMIAYANSENKNSGYARALISIFEDKYWFGNGIYNIQTAVKSNINSSNPNSISGINLSKNPAKINEEIQISSFDLIRNVTIFDIGGKISSHVESIDSNNYIFKLAQHGLHFIAIELENGDRFTKKIIVSN